MGQTRGGPTLDGMTGQVGDDVAGKAFGHPQPDRAGSHLGRAHGGDPVAQPDDAASHDGELVHQVGVGPQHRAARGVDRLQRPDTAVGEGLPSRRVQVVQHRHPVGAGHRLDPGRVLDGGTAPEPTGGDDAQDDREPGDRPEQHPAAWSAAGQRCGAGGRRRGHPPHRQGRAGGEPDDAKVAASGREVASNATAAATVRASGVGTVDPSAVPGA